MHLSTDISQKISIKIANAGYGSYPAFRLSRDPLTEGESTFGKPASQSFPARRRENKVKIRKLQGHVPWILHDNRASVRLRRARSPMQILLRSKQALIESVAKRLFATQKCRIRLVSCILASGVNRHGCKGVQVLPRPDAGQVLIIGLGADHGAVIAAELQGGHVE